MTKRFFIGVDGGATKCIVRLEDESGQLLSRSTGGPANIRLSVDQSWQSIQAAMAEALQPFSLSPNDPNYEFHVGMGLAGCEITTAYEAFLRHSHTFKTLLVTSDSHAACLGAHGGEDGAIIIAGTGVVGFQIQRGDIAKVGGWGFPHDDEGGGAWLGLQAIKVTLQWLDGRQPDSGLSNAVYAYFSGDQDRLVNWANQANSTAFAELAPLVIQEAQAEDSVAIQILQQAAQALDSVGEALLAAQYENTKPLPCALIGSIAPFLQPYLNPALRMRLRSCLTPPDAGALLLARHDCLEKDKA